MQWLIDAHEELTDNPLPELSVRYSGRFKGYNANVRYGRGWMRFSLSKRWEGVDVDIRKGVVQHLMCRVYGVKASTLGISLYEEFIRQSSEYAERGHCDPLLVERFGVINEEYFGGLLVMPTLEWGGFSTTRLGHYDYADDRVRLSTALRDDIDMLDYVLYHELLHKKHKFVCKDGRTHHHTASFRLDERRFRIKDAEARLSRYIAGKRREKRLGKNRLKRFFG